MESFWSGGATCIDLEEVGPLNSSQIKIACVEHCMVNDKSYKVDYLLYL